MSDTEILEELMELHENDPVKPVYIKVVGGPSGWMVGVEDAEDGPTLLVELNQ